MFAWVCTNVFTNTIITNNKSYIQTLDLLNSSVLIHATPYLFWLTDILNITPIIVTIVNRLTITLKQARSMCIQVPINQMQVIVIILENVYYYLNMNFSLISQALLCREEYSFMFTNNICKITLLCNTYIRYIQMTSNLYIIYNNHLLKTMNELTIYNLHKQLGHISYNYIKQLLKEHPNVLKTKVTNYKEKECIECIKANI